MSPVRGGNRIGMMKMSFTANDLDKLTKDELLRIADKADVKVGQALNKHVIVARIAAVYGLGDYRSRRIENEYAMLCAKRYRNGQRSYFNEREPEQMESGFHQCGYCRRWFKVDFDYCPRCGKERGKH